jgi:hypothetical protein
VQVGGGTLLCLLRGRIAVRRAQRTLERMDGLPEAPNSSIGVFAGTYGQPLAQGFWRILPTQNVSQPDNLAELMLKRLMDRNLADGKN